MLKFTELAPIETIGPNQVYSVLRNNSENDETRLSCGFPQLYPECYLESMLEGVLPGLNVPDRDSRISVAWLRFPCQSGYGFMVTNTTVYAHDGCRFIIVSKYEFKAGPNTNNISSLFYMLRDGEVFYENCSSAVYEPELWADPTDTNALVPHILEHVTSIIGKMELEHRRLANIG